MKREVTKKSESRARAARALGIPINEIWVSKKWKPFAKYIIFHELREICHRSRERGFTLNCKKTLFWKAWLACVKLGRAPVFGSEYSSMYDKLEGVKGPCLQGWWVSRVRIACAFWMIGEGLTEKKPVFNIPCLFGSKYVRRFRSRVHVNIKQDEANTRRKNAKK